MGPASSDPRGTFVASGPGHLARVGAVSLHGVPPCITTGAFAPGGCGYRHRECVMSRAVVVYYPTTTPCTTDPPTPDISLSVLAAVVCEWPGGSGVPLCLYSSYH